MRKDNKTEYDVAVIGGGPAGIMAAGRAAELGAKVVLIERNKELGRKFLLTGKGRCNITNSELNPRKFADYYGKQGQFILSAFSIFGVKQAIEFFEKNGLEIKTERGGRLFPKSDKAKDVLLILKKFLKTGKVKIMRNSRVIKISREKNELSGSKLRSIPSGKLSSAKSQAKDNVFGENKITGILIKRDKKIIAKNYIFCAGGKSYPELGSSGDGFLWAKKIGHTISKPRPSLVPIKIKEKWPKLVQGLSLKNISITLLKDGKKKDSRFGEALFTHFGLSGPIVLDMSKKVGEFLDLPLKNRGEIKLSLDLKPALNFEKLDKRIQRDFEKYQNKMFKNSLDDLLPENLIPIIIEFSGINQRKEVNKITRDERHKLVKLFKGIEMTVSGVLGFDRAIVTSGGISLKEIDSKTMKSKLVDNLFFAGEIIDLDGPCGGYNLQLCWATGYVAGQNAANGLK